MDSSLKSILNVTISIILSMMSTQLMCIIDRFMLAGYSIDSMNAAVMSGNFVSIFTLMFVGMINSTGIIIGQFNGAKQYSKLAVPVWQMFYLSLAASALFAPIAYFSDYIHILPQYYEKDGVNYQKILMYFAILPPLRTALSAFFIGQGKTKIIIFSVAIGIATNIMLDYFLIYGIKNVISSMGCRGAAIATNISEFAQIVVLAVVFFSSKNKKVYKTFENRKFNKNLGSRLASSFSY